ncbi:hypothetical protein ACQ02O_001745 [Enterobacter kobei]
MMTDKDLTDDVLDEIIAGAKTSMEQYLALSLKAERAANRQQNSQQNIPENIPVNTPCKDAPEHIWLQTAGVWPENGEFSELTWCSDNQHPDDTLYVRADVVAGNSPVIPDGWKLVPIELTGDMTNAMSEAILDDLHNVDVWRSVLAAAPQQEVKP